MRRTVTVEEMKEAVTLVYRECNGNLPLTFKIRESVEELYDAQIIEKYPELREYQGAYFPRDGRVEIICSHILSGERGNGQSEGGNEKEKSEERRRAIEAGLTVVRHEVLGHYALNTCSAEQKQNILETIVKNKHEPSLQEEWKDVEKHYSDRTEMQQAEEVFCFVAENKPKLDVNFDLSSQPFTLKHVEQIAARIAEGIRLGERTQQIFPANNQAQFYQQESRQKPLDLNQHYTTDYHWSSSDKKMILTINGQSPTVIDARVLSQIAKRDKFLSCYDVATLRTGKLDLRVAQGEQPVPKTYDGRGELVSQSEPQQAMKLK
jgi:hypothetical protein